MKKYIFHSPIVSFDNIKLKPIRKKMKIKLLNYWIGNPMKDGGAFPINLLTIYADLNPSFRCYEFTILNFGISISKSD